MHHSWIQRILMKYNVSTTPLATLWMLWWKWNFLLCFLFFTPILLQIKLLVINARSNVVHYSGFSIMHLSMQFFGFFKLVKIKTFCANELQRYYYLLWTKNSKVHLKWEKKPISPWKIKQKTFHNLGLS